MNWDDVVATAHDEPIVYQVLTMMQMGLFTREEGAAALILAYQSALRQTRAELLRVRNSKPIVYFIPKET